MAADKVCTSLVILGASPKENEKSLMDQFWASNRYMSGSYTDKESIAKLNAELKKLENGYDVGNRLFYLALPSSVFEEVASCLRETAMSSTGWNRIVLEKPFGKDSESYAQLNRHICNLFTEDQVFRVDHFLSHEMIQTLLILRFANYIFRSLWNSNSIKCVVVTYNETFGTEGRGGYFDEYGIIRDMVQNHLLQVLCLVAMEKPVTTGAKDIRDEKVKLLRCIPEAKLSDVVLGQYVGSLQAEGGAKAGYQDDESVPDGSLAPTFATVVLQIKNERWDGVPFILQCGKGDVFQGKCHRNELVIRMLPDEAMYLKIMMKQPGFSFEPIQGELDLTYRTHFKDLLLPHPYERVILSILSGDQASFVRSDELKEAWRIFTPLLHQIENEHVTPYKYTYGSSAPKLLIKIIRLKRGSRTGHEVEILLAMALRLLLSTRLTRVAHRQGAKAKPAFRSGSSTSHAHNEPTTGPEPPNGFLFNEKPLRPGEKRQKEDWENIWVYGMTFNLLLAFAVVVLKPDTSISSWGRKKALERLSGEASGETTDDPVVPTEEEAGIVSEDS
eukprot:Em0001g1150a